MFPFSVHVAAFAAIVVLFVCLQIGFVTVTVHIAVLPDVVFAVIVAVPSATAVTFPLLSTVAFILSLLSQVIVSVEFSGVTVAVNVSLFPFSKDNFVLFITIFCQ